MSCDWEKLSLKEAGVFLIDCVHKTPKAQNSGFPYIGIPQMKKGHIDFNESPRLISPEDYKEWTVKAKPRASDIVLSRRCNPGETAYVQGNTEFALGQNLVLLRSSGGRVFPPFMQWLVKGNEWWSEVGKYRNSGAVFDSLKCADIPNFEMTIPPYSLQERISEFLGCVDKKITLNTQINQTLEQMAQALFKSWFVDFDPVIDNALEAGNLIPEPLAERAIRRQARWAAESEKAPACLPAETRRLFPDRFEEDDALGWVPVGWKTQPLSQQITLIGGGTPKRSEESFWGGDISWFSVKDAPSESDVFVIDTEDKITQAGLEGSSAKLLPVGTTIITARGTVGKLAITGKEMAMNQSCYGVRPIKGLGNYFNYYNVKNAVVGLQQNVHGAVFDTITKKTFETVSSPLPNENVVAEFESRVAVLMGKIKAAREENIFLTQLRDTLLPKLLSGELQLPEAEAAVETALEAEFA